MAQRSRQRSLYRPVIARSSILGGDCFFIILLILHLAHLRWSDLFSPNGALAAHCTGTAGARVVIGSRRGAGTTRKHERVGSTEENDATQRLCCFPEFWLFASHHWLLHDNSIFQPWCTAVRELVTFLPFLRVLKKCWHVSNSVIINSPFLHVLQKSVGFKSPFSNSKKCSSAIPKNLNTVLF